MPKNKSFGALVKEYGFTTRQNRFPIHGESGKRNRKSVGYALRDIIKRDGLAYQKDLLRSLNSAFRHLTARGPGDTGPFMSNPAFRKARTEKALTDLLDVSVRSMDDVSTTTLGDALLQAYDVDRRRHYELRGGGEIDQIIYYIDLEPLNAYLNREFSHVPTFVK